MYILNDDKQNYPNFCRQLMVEKFGQCKLETTYDVFIKVSKVFKLTYERTLLRYLKG